MKKKMPERTVFNMIRVILVIPFLFIYALILATDAMLSGIISVIAKSLTYCVRSVILVIAPDFVDAGIIDMKP